MGFFNFFFIFYNLQIFIWGKVFKMLHSNPWYMSLFCFKTCILNGLLSKYCQIFCSFYCTFPTVKHSFFRDILSRTKILVFQSLYLNNKQKYLSSLFIKSLVLTFFPFRKIQVIQKPVVIYSLILLHTTSNFYIY